MRGHTEIKMWGTAFLNHKVCHIATHLHPVQTDGISADGWEGRSACLGEGPQESGNRRMRSNGTSCDAPATHRVDVQCGPNLTELARAWKHCGCAALRLHSSSWLLNPLQV